MRDERAGKIGAVASQSCDPPVAGGANKARHYRNNSCFEKRQQDFPSVAPRVLQVRLCVTKILACQDKIRRSDGHGCYPDLTESCGEESSSISFSKRGQSVKQSPVRLNAASRRRLMKKIIGQERQFLLHTVVLFGQEVQILQGSQMKFRDGFRFLARLPISSEP